VPRHLVASIQTTSERGGAEYAHVDLLDALIARGREVLLLTNLPELAEGTSVPVRTIDLGPKLSSRNALLVGLRMPLTLLTLCRALRAHRPGTLLLHFKKEQLLCSMLPKRLTGEIFWFEWGPVPEAMRSGIGRLVYGLAARRAVRIFAISEGTATTIAQASGAPEKIVTLPDLVNLHVVRYDAAGRERLRREWGAGDETLVVGCISRLQRRKRTDVLIDAMKLTDRDAVLVISGNGPEEQRLRARAAPVGRRVRFVANARGHVDQLLSACDLLAFAPSPNEAGRPRVIVMAQLVGLPVLATHPEGASAVSDAHAGTVVSPHNDPVAVAGAIDEYASDPERRRREGQRGRDALLRSFDPARTLDELERLLGLS
jgi:glycosyltransferase involved in cell wall biosynthesis